MVSSSVPFEFEWVCDARPGNLGISVILEIKCQGLHLLIHSDCHRHSDNGLVPFQYQAITGIYAELLSDGPSGKNFL